jgi:hypothetical protein
MFFFALGAKLPRWESNVGCLCSRALTPQILQRLPGAYRRGPKLLANDTLNKTELNFTKMETDGSSEATNPLGKWSNRSGNKLNLTIPQILLKHESEPLGPQRKFGMVPQPRNLASVNLPLTIYL